MVLCDDQESKILEKLEQHAQFLEAIENNDAVAIRDLICGGVHPDSDIGIGCAPLAAAALHGSVQAASALIEGGANVYLMDDDGETALTIALAAACNRLSEEDASAENDIHDAPFQQGVFEGSHVHIARLLLESGARADTGNGAVNEFFLKCCDYGQTDLVQLMLDCGANVNARDFLSTTPLMHATSAPDVFKLLIERGAEVTAQCDLEITILDVLLGEGSLDLAELVVDHGGDVNEQNYYLTRAAADGEYEVVQFLLRNGVDPTRADDEGKTPLQMARYHGHREISLLLREAIGLPSVQKLDAARAIRKQHVRAAHHSRSWERLLQFFRTKNFERDRGETFLRSWWLAQQMCNKCAIFFARTVIDATISGDRICRNDRGEFFEVLAYSSSYVLKTLRDEMAQSHDPRKAHDLHIGYVVALGIAFDRIFGLIDEGDGVFVELLNAYYRPDYDEDYEGFWALCWYSEDTFERKTVGQLWSEQRPEEDYNVERYYVHRLNKRMKIADPARIIAELLPYREIGINLYDAAFFGRSTSAIERELRDMVNAQSERIGSKIQTDFRDSCRTESQHGSKRNCNSGHDTIMSEARDWLSATAARITQVSWPDSSASDGIHRFRPTADSGTDSCEGAGQALAAIWFKVLENTLPQWVDAAEASLGQLNGGAASNPEHRQKFRLELAAFAFVLFRIAIEFFGPEDKAERLRVFEAFDSRASRRLDTAFLGPVRNLVSASRNW